MRFLRGRLNAYAIYMLYSGLSAFAQNTIFTMNIVYQVETVKLNPLQLILVGTTLETTCFLCQVPTGVLADTYSRRLSIIIGTLLCGVGFLIEGLFPTFVVVLLAQVLWGIGATFTSGAQEAWVSDEVGTEKVGRTFIRATQIGQIAALASIPFSTWLAATRLNIPIITGSLMLIALSFFLFIVMPERHFRAAAREERSSWRAMGKMMVDGFRAVRHSSLLLIILAITIFAAMSSEGFDRLNIAHFAHDYTFPALGHLSSVTWFGIISAGAMLLTLLVTEIIRRSVDMRKQRATVIAMFGCQLGLIIGLAVFALSGNFYVALLAYWIARTCRNADIPLYNAWLVQNSDPRMRATIISMFGQVDAIGQIAGGPGVGLIGSLVSLRAALLATCAILFPNVFFFVRALQLSKREPLEIEEEDACNLTL